MRKSWNRIRSVRRAAATVEMAVVAPILLGLLFAIIEYGWIFMLQSNMTSATREACRVGILPGATDADIRTRFAEAVAGTGLTEASGSSGGGYQLEIQRSGAANENLTVRARVPWKEASLVGGGLLPDPRKLVALVGSKNASGRSSDMVASSSMFREGSR